MDKSSLLLILLLVEIGTILGRCSLLRNDELDRFKPPNMLCPNTDAKADVGDIAPELEAVNAANVEASILFLSVFDKTPNTFGLIEENWLELLYSRVEL